MTFRSCLRQQDALALRAGHDPVDGLLQGGHRDLLAVGPRGQQRALVDHVGQVGAGEAGGTAGDDVEVGVGGDGLAAGVHLQDALAAGQVRLGHHDLAVEPARAQQRRVEDVGPVGGRDDDDAALGVEPVQLDQHLVQGLLALVVAAAETRAAVPAHGVDLVHEHDGRGVRLGLLEQVAHPGGTDTDEHLHEVRPGDRVERHAGLAGHGPGQQRLTGAGRPVEQHALGDLGPDGLEFGRILQELLDLLQFLDRLVGPGHVGERRLGRVLGDQLGAGLAEVHHPRAAALHLRQHEEEQQEDHDVDEGRGQQVKQRVALGDVDVVALRQVALAVLLLKHLLELQALAGDPLSLPLRTALGPDLDRLLGRDLDRLVLVGDYRALQTWPWLMRLTISECLPAGRCCRNWRSRARKATTAPPPRSAAAGPGKSALAPSMSGPVGPGPFPPDQPHIPVDRRRDGRASVLAARFRA